MAKELLKLRLLHHLSLNDVALLSGIDIVYVARMELGVPVESYYAQKLRLSLGEKLHPVLTKVELPIIEIGDEGGSNIYIGKVFS